MAADSEAGRTLSGKLSQGEGNSADSASRDSPYDNSGSSLKRYEKGGCPRSLPVMKADLLLLYEQRQRDALRLQGLLDDLQQRRSQPFQVYLFSRSSGKPVQGLV